MPELISYLLKVNVALLLFCGGYYFILRRLTFYTLNRIYLIMAIFFSTIYPLVDLSPFFQQHEHIIQPVQVIILDLQAPAKQLIAPIAQPDYWQIAIMLFWCGVIVMASRLAFQMASLYLLHRRSVPGKLNNYQVRMVNSNIGPFSFWRNIYINPDMLERKELDAVLEHEHIHVKEWHTLDILLAELSIVFYWFNPGVWLMKKAVKENIEFITDRRILQNGLDTKAYQYSLLSVSMATNSNTIVNNFNISTIKKRIIMMNSKRSSALNLTRYVFVLPVMIALLLVFTLSKAEVAKNVVSEMKKAIEAATEKNVTNAQAEQASEQKVTGYIKNLRLLPLSAPKASIYKDTVPKPKVELKSVIIKNADSTDYYINGIKITQDALNKLKSDSISSINILSSETAQAIIPGSAKKGVVMITTKGNENNQMAKVIADKITTNRLQTLTGKIAKVKIEGTMVLENVTAPVTVVGKPLATASARVTVTGRSINDTSALNAIAVVGYGTKSTSSWDNSLIIIDGKEVSADELKKVTAADISSVNVKRGLSEVEKHGDKAKNGVVYITTKKK